jgi:hypothetical protein
MNKHKFYFAYGIFAKLSSTSPMASQPNGRIQEAQPQVLLDAPP